MNPEPTIRGGRIDPPETSLRTRLVETRAVPCSRREPVRERRLLRRPVSAAFTTHMAVLITERRAEHRGRLRTTRLARSGPIPSW